MEPADDFSALPAGARGVCVDDDDGMRDRRVEEESERCDGGVRRRVQRTLDAYYQWSTDSAGDGGQSVCCVLCAGRGGRSCRRGDILDEGDEEEGRVSRFDSDATTVNLIGSDDDEEEVGKDVVHIDTEDEDEEEEEEMEWVCHRCWSSKSPQEIFLEVISRYRNIEKKLHFLLDCCQSCLTSDLGLVGGELWLSHVLQHHEDEEEETEDEESERDVRKKDAKDPLHRASTTSGSGGGRGGSWCMFDIEEIDGLLSRRYPHSYPQNACRRHYTTPSVTEKHAEGIHRGGSPNTQNGRHVADLTSASSHFSCAAAAGVPRVLTHPVLRYHAVHATGGATDRSRRWVRLSSNGCENIDCGIVFEKRRRMLEREEWAAVVSYVKRRCSSILLNQEKKTTKHTHTK